MTAEPLPSTDTPTPPEATTKVKSARRSNHFYSTATSFHDSHGQPLRTELSVQYPNMPRRERRRLARLIAEMETKKEKKNG